MDIIISLSFATICNYMATYKLWVDKDNKNIFTWYYVYSMGINNYHLFRVFDNPGLEGNAWLVFIVLCHIKNIISIIAVLRNDGTKKIAILAVASFATYPLLYFTINDLTILRTISELVLVFGYSFALYSCVVSNYLVTKNKSFEGVSIPANLIVTIDLILRANYNLSEGIVSLFVLNCLFLLNSIYKILLWISVTLKTKKHETVLN